jgi:hypothetical protein
MPPRCSPVRTDQRQVDVFRLDHADPEAPETQLPGRRLLLCGGGGCRGGGSCNATLPDSPNKLWNRESALVHYYNLLLQQPCSSPEVGGGFGSDQCAAAHLADGPAAAKRRFQQEMNTAPPRKAEFWLMPRAQGAAPKGGYLPRAYPRATSAHPPNEGKHERRTPNPTHGPLIRGSGVVRLRRSCRIAKHANASGVVTSSSERQTDKRRHRRSGRQMSVPATMRCV